MPKKIKNDARINMRLPSALMEWAKDYAYQGDTTLTQIFIDHLYNLKDDERIKAEKEANGEQTGIPSYLIR